ncbi:MAG TPA: hypothetical protein VE262_03795 [Blastocatellia bacterium]|nr:hypothetical protein [Blastocatellia bacterium]
MKIAMRALVEHSCFWLWVPALRVDLAPGFPIHARELGRGLSYCDVGRARFDSPGLTYLLRAVDLVS